MFRQRPSELFFNEAQKKDIGIIVRVPLASGLLTGAFSKSTSFTEGDHRQFNRNGEAFDKGETFSGIDYNKGIEAVEELKLAFPDIDNLAPNALKWILGFPEISCIIPGSSRPEQVLQNLKAIDTPTLTNKQLESIQQVYAKRIKPLVHQLW